MKIAIQGLGRMGMQMVRKLTEAEGFEVIGYDVNEDAVKEAADESKRIWDKWRERKLI